MNKDVTSSWVEPCALDFSLLSLSTVLSLSISFRSLCQSSKSTEVQWANYKTSALLHPSLRVSVCAACIYEPE